MNVQLFLFYRLRAYSLLIDRARGFCDDLVKIYCTSVAEKRGWEIISIISGERYFISTEASVI